MLESNDLFLVIWALGCIVVVLVLAFWITRFMAGSGRLRGTFRRRNSGQIEVLTQELLGKDQRLVVARVGERYFLMGVTAQSISLLSELSADEVVSPAEPVEPTQQNPSFFEAFSSTLKEKMRR